MESTVARHVGTLGLEDGDAAEWVNSIIILLGMKKTKASLVATFENIIALKTMESPREPYNLEAFFTKLFDEIRPRTESIVVAPSPAPHPAPSGPPLAKRQRQLQKWSELQNSVKSPTEVPLPELIEELPPPAFVAPKGWMDDLCEEVRVQFHRQDSGNPRVSPVAVVRCSRGGKTRALHELAWALPLTLQKKDNETADGTAIIYVSFNGHMPLSPWEKNRPLEALCRRILYTAFGGKPNPIAFNSFATSTVFEKEDVTDWLGNANCILLIDELNLLEATMNEDLATFLKDTFLLDTGRALVFSSDVVSVNNKLMSCMHSPNEREVKIKKLPLARNLFQARDLLDYPDLSPHLALYLGLIPALYYGARQNSLPHQRREDAIQDYVDAAVSLEKVESLLMTMLTGEYALVPEVFREFMDVDVVGKKPIALWIPYHMAEVLLTLSRHTALPIAVRRCLGTIHKQFQSFRNQKIQSGDGWEALFIVTLLTRCLTKSFCKLVPLYGFDDGEVSWNEPFKNTKVDFGCESVKEFVSGIPFRRSTKSISIYYPTHAQFQVYDVILACWGDNLERQLHGYQLKEGSTVPKGFAMEDLFIRSYLIRGKATTKDSSIRRWALDDFFASANPPAFVTAAAAGGLIIPAAVDNDDESQYDDCIVSAWTAACNHNRTLNLDILEVIPSRDIDCLSQEVVQAVAQLKKSGYQEWVQVCHEMSLYETGARMPSLEDDVVIDVYRCVFQDGSDVVAESAKEAEEIRKRTDGAAVSCNPTSLLVGQAKYPCAWRRRSRYLTERTSIGSCGTH